MEGDNNDSTTKNFVTKGERDRQTDRETEQLTFLHQ